MWQEYISGARHGEAVGAAGARAFSKEEGDELGAGQEGLCGCRGVTELFDSQAALAGHAKI